MFKENGGVRQIKLNDDFDENEFGDKFIREARITREQEIRLKYIDSNLQKMSSLSHARFGTSKASDSNYDFDQNEINVIYFNFFAFKTKLNLPNLSIIQKIQNQISISF